MFNDLKRGKIYGPTYTQVMGIQCLIILFAFNIVKFKLVNKSAYICDRAVFNLVPKVIRVCLGFALQRSMIV